ncbi:hypothetical protein [Nitrospirillum amazonense]|uniref:hypothetical protein n=1 Tax=Nitrospirillum amazonense TaxID=28077 RepID=UPI002412CFE2|nr:hypothetical protein [Nitrospirillum amazonense]MDG3444631.1 hypothetical protein [Nitrospirillum amazonense]
MDPEQELTAAIQRFGDQRYSAGIEVGLAVAERIVGWLSMQPDTPRQREQRQWAERAIAAARAEDKS